MSGGSGRGQEVREEGRSLQGCAGWVCGARGRAALDPCELWPV